DMRGAEARKVKGDTSMAFFLNGPTVLPGRYQVRLQVGEESWTQPIEILSDPRGHETPEGDRARYDLLVNINRKLSEAHDAVNQIRDLNEQLAAWKKRAKGQESGAGIGEAADALRKTLVAIEQELFKTEPHTDMDYTTVLKLSARMAALKFAVDFTDYAPTTQAAAVYEELAGKIDAQVARLREVLGTDLARVNQRIRDTALPAIAASLEAATPK